MTQEVQPRWEPNRALKLERMAVPAGWLTRSLHNAGGRALAFVPDEEHRWNWEAAPSPPRPGQHFTLSPTPPPTVTTETTLGQHIRLRRPTQIRPQRRFE